MSLAKKSNISSAAEAPAKVGAMNSSSVRLTADAEKRRARTFARQQKGSERLASATAELSSGISEASSASEELRKAAEQISVGAEEASAAAQQTMKSMSSANDLLRTMKTQADSSSALMQTLSDLVATTSRDVAGSLHAITDLNMGGMSGIDLVREARKLPGHGFMPIVLLTTESSQDMRNLAKSAGATGWLTKPVESEALLRIVRKLVPDA